MKNLILNFVILFFVSLNAVSQDGKFTFNIPSTVTTSAGVFKNDSVLIRTLWNNVEYAPGTYTKNWDGKDDYGVSITSPASNYKVKIISNNVQYQWQGTIGNTSANQTGPTKHKGYYYCMKGLAFGPEYGYFGTGYSEGFPSFAKFNINTPNEKINILDATTSTCDVSFVATDGKKVYWGGADANLPNHSFVFGTHVSDDAYVSFTSGVNYTPVHRDKLNVIAYVNTSKGLISGLAVQKTGEYLFVARRNINQVQVINKTTGGLVRTLTFDSPRGLSVDGSDNLWMASGTATVSKYNVRGDGTLTSAIITLSGLLDPLATQVSFDGTLLTVADGSTSQQVKFFNNSTGAATNTLGIAGGYGSEATASNNKFYFSDVNGLGTAQYTKQTFLAFQPDNSFWVGDPGNFRVQHYNPNRVYIDNIMSLGANYNMFADKNNINKVFSEFQEFEIDYSVQALTGTQGWSLKKNWGANISTAIYDGSPRYQTTLSNGRTYGLLRKSSMYEVVEFPSSGQLRFTGKLISISNVLCSDGSLQTTLQSGKTFTIKRFPLTGFDGTGNPVWETTGQTLAIGTADKTIGNPIETPGSQVFSTSDKILFYNPHGDGFTTGYHLGLMQLGANNSFLFQTEKSTSKDYGGAYPPPGWFDIGNGVNEYAGGNANIIDRNIITSYHGEGWKGTQTNKYNHYYDNGLAIGQFGTTRPDAGLDAIAAPEMAGNVVTAVVVKDGNGSLYLYHGDEGDHSAFHRWKISGLNTIAEQVIPIAYPSAYTVPTPNYVDLMAGLPFDAALKNNTAGWTRQPATNEERDPYKVLWRVNTSKHSFDKIKDNDVSIEFLNQTATTSTVSRDLGTNNVTHNWKVEGSLAYDGNMPNGSAVNQYFEILDDNGKILTTFYPIMNRAVKPAVASIAGNGQTITSGSESSIRKMMNILIPFTISVADGVVTFTYGNYTPVTAPISDATGNWRKPATLRARFQNTGSPTPKYGANIAFQNLKFYKDDLVPPNATNQPPAAGAGADQTITLPISTVTLAGSGTDPDGTISSYSWRQISGPLTGLIATPNAATTIINGLIQGVYRIELTVTDNNGATGQDTIQVTVNAAAAVNLFPAVNPANTVNGLDYEYYEGNWSFLPSFSSLTPVKKGTTTNFDLSLANRPAQYGFSFTGFINVPADGQYKFYTSSDDGSNLYIDNVLTVENDGLHGENEESGTIGLKAGKHAITGLFFQQGGGQIFKVSYEGMGISKQAIPVSKLYRIAIANGNSSPLANAGGDKTITLPISTVTLTGSGTDTDGIINSYSWVQVSGPGAGAITNSNSASTSVTGLVKGIYQFQLTVTDNNGAVGNDMVQVTVNAGANEVPTANAGPNITIVLPVKTAILSGAGSDTDGTIVSYSWVKLSGPKGDVIEAPDEASTIVSSLVLGMYKYQLTVTDNSGAISSDFMWVTVNSTSAVHEQPRSRVLANDNNFNPAVVDSVNVPVAKNIANPKFSKSNELKVFPNPAKDIANLSITANGKNQQLSISVYNSLGMLVHYKQLLNSQVNTMYKLDMSGLSSGIYSVIVSFDNGEKISYKLIKGSE